MITIENVSVVGWEPAIRGMRNPMNSWAKSDTLFFDYAIDTCLVCHDILYNIHKIDTSLWTNVDYNVQIGANDLALMKNLSLAGEESATHAKFRRMIVVYMDVTAPLYWWKEYDTYKVGTVANSCSTMHKIHSKEFELDDFSHEHLCELSIADLNRIIETLNKCRQLFLETKDKKYWWQMIQLLPSSFNQKRTLMLNYEVLHSIYRDRKNHKLDEWRSFCTWIRDLPYSELITMEEKDGHD